MGQIQPHPLEPREVHVWKYQITKWKKGCLSLLSEYEKSRWVRIYPEENQRRFAQVHAFLRQVLELYTGVPAARIEIIQLLNGKPKLKEPPNPPIYFSLSYRDEYAVVALSRNCFIGADIEAVKMIDHISSFISSYFSYEERQKVLGYKNKYDRLAMLFSIWVMKEAYIKANTMGISESIAQFNLCPFLDTPECKPDFDLSSTWHIAQFRVADNYKAACAVRAGRTYLKVYDFHSD